MFGSLRIFRKVSKKSPHASSTSCSSPKTLNQILTSTLDIDIDMAPLGSSSFNSLRVVFHLLWSAAMETMTGNDGLALLLVYLCMNEGIEQVGCSRANPDFRRL